MVAMPHLPTPAKPTATRKDVAQLAGVSTAVVSYVVNGGPKRVSPATEAKVRDAIAALGYRPNAAARALKLGSSEMLGMVVPDITSPFFATLTHAVEEAAVARGYALLMANSGGSLSAERRAVEQLASRRVDGVFLSSVLFEPDLRELEAMEIPAVLLNHSTESPGFDSVGVDFVEAGRAAVEHLVSHGHRNIGLIMGITTGGGLDGREAGWRKGLEDAGLPVGPVMRQPFDRDGGYQAGKWLLNSAERPTAIFASSDLIAVGLLRAFHEGGVRVPDDVAIVSFDGLAESEYCWPPLTTLAQPVEEMAQAAVEALVEGGGHKSNRRFHATLVRRESCGCGAP
ncbi:LacI family DNA-binding transcriptional regulator [Sinomonas sp. ASV322]|uniref:LacI family DNA-binding transcriptional regulator n=1 Tax=Sinomonas sp. ASV322 TaxID=3041920 RepID=UPI0027DC77EE|nr:LacI family DNA-binding transcriptional regulator [Sinomonas sp. ASV322]MDQ4503800.1 LacI family DNA-binding transcriptional regulator [Sinomonas sp. ASV322]